MRITPFILLLLILILGAFLRFYLIQEVPLGLYPDEAMNGNNAMEALATGEFKIFYPENNGREGLFINLQAISLAVFGNEPWALRLVSAIFGTLTILGIYLLTKELFSQNQAQIKNETLKVQNDNQKSKTFQFFAAVLRFALYALRSDNLTKISKNEIIALLSAFFTATSYWHLNFSRIGFRAIAVPFFASFGLYFLLKGLRQGNILNLIWAGIFIGLGFHTYIAFRLMPFVLAVPLGWYLWEYKTQSSTFESRASSRGKLKAQNDNLKLKNLKYCTPCAIALFLFITFVVALPMGWYFLQNPGDFLGRSGQVSIFSAESPLKEFVKSSGLTLQMFFWQGDCNWRHNLACQPQLNLLVSIFFGVGILLSIKTLFQTWQAKIQNDNKEPTAVLTYTLLFVWFIMMSLPAALTREGLPHALRAIGMIPPVMILAALGAYWVLEKITAWLEKQKEKWPNYLNQLQRIKKELVWLFILMLLWTVPGVYRDYFRRWAENPNTFYAFSTDLLHLGKFLEKLPQDTQKYVVVNMSGVDVRGLSAPAQTIMFATDTFQEEAREQKNVIYITPENWEKTLQVSSGKKILAAFMDGNDRQLIYQIQQKFTELKIQVPEDFVVLQNY